MRYLISQIKENIKKNLHPSAIPYDETRTLRDKKGFYISANDVISPEQSYIIAQAPTEETLSDFWTAILETNTRHIVALAMPQGERKEFADYFLQERFPVIVADWTIEFIDESVAATSIINPAERIVQRTFRAKNNTTAHIINHIHYEN